MKKAGGQTLDEASRTLGISKDALRKRIKRGHVEATKSQDGRWIVYLADKSGQNIQDNASEQLVERMGDEISFLKQELAIRNEQIKNMQILLKQEQDKNMLLLGMPPEPKASESDRGSFLKRLFKL